MQIDCWNAVRLQIRVATTIPCKFGPEWVRPTSAIIGSYKHSTPGVVHVESEYLSSVRTPLQELRQLKIGPVFWCLYNHPWVWLSMAFYLAPYYISMHMHKMVSFVKAIDNYIGVCQLK